MGPKMKFFCYYCPSSDCYIKIIMIHNHRIFTLPCLYKETETVGFRSDVVYFGSIDLHITNLHIHTTDSPLGSGTFPLLQSFIPSHSTDLPSRAVLASLVYVGKYVKLQKITRFPTELPGTNNLNKFPFTLPLNTKNNCVGFFSAIFVSSLPN